MSANNRQIIAYCPENQELADSLAASLRSAGNEITLSDCSSGGLGKAGETADANIILLMTDNFLKNAGCLENGLAAAQKLVENNRLTTVVADGFTVDASGEKQVVHTSFERVSNVIHYMNHWQDRYLELRRQRRQHEDDAVL